jgi:tRNA-dihydrouridine synthase A
MNRKFAIAPMMEWTDRHCRFFHRLLTRRALIYTEMVTTGAVLHGDRGRLIGFDDAEHPVALQLGGCEAKALAECARIGAGFGYDEVNLNVGCPSDRVQEGRFGACLMAEPALVADCVAAMKAAVAIPVTVKCRIGIDDQDPEEALEIFACAVEAAGADALIVHARKAWLKGLSPRENRDVPPLDYEVVYRLKARHPQLPVVLNGGIGSVEAAAAHVGSFPPALSGRVGEWGSAANDRWTPTPDPTPQGGGELAISQQAARVDGVMMGRAAYQEPWRLLMVDPLLFSEPAPFGSPKDAALALMPYIERELARGVRLHAITRHLHGLFQAVPGARAFRRHLATEAVKPGACASVLAEALARVVDRPARLAQTAAA